MWLIFGGFFLGVQLPVCLCSCSVPDAEFIDVCMVMKEEGIHSGNSIRPTPLSFFAEQMVDRVCAIVEMEKTVYTLTVTVLTRSRFPLI